MLSEILTKFADDKQTASLATKLRKKRFSLFNSLVRLVSAAPLKILDVGGTQVIWETEGFCAKSRDVEIAILNVQPIQVNHSNIKSFIGDARNMNQFKDNEFDIIFSNSVIEHVGTYEDQRQMANEIKRVGKRYFLQTPNYYFIIEPHFVFPFFQFFPLWAKVWLVGNFDIGWCKKTTDKQKASAYVSSIRLLTKKELIDLFPNATICEEKLFGLTKSFMVYEGWEASHIS